jgi:hypothetical protein
VATSDLLKVLATSLSQSAMHSVHSHCCAAAGHSQCGDFIPAGSARYQPPPVCNAFSSQSLLRCLQGILNVATSNLLEVVPASFGQSARVLVGTGRFHDPVIVDGWSGYQHERRQVITHDAGINHAGFFLHAKPQRQGCTHWLRAFQPM